MRRRKLSPSGSDADRKNGTWTLDSAAPCRTKMNLAIGSSVNGAMPLMRVMVPCGTVAGLLSEKPFPFSVPAS